MCDDLNAKHVKRKMANYFSNMYLFHELNHHTYFPNGSPNAYIFDCCNEHQMNDGFSKPNKITNFAVARNHSIAYFRVTIFKNISVTSLAPKTE